VLESVLLLCCSSLSSPHHTHTQTTEEVRQKINNGVKKHQQIER
jgi:hypothetical protein